MYLEAMEEMFVEEEGEGRGVGKEEREREKEKQRLKGQMTNWKEMFTT